MMLFDKPDPIRPEDVRRAILKLLADNEVPVEVAGRAVAQCLDLLRDVARVHELSREIGLDLTGFRSDDSLEFSSIP